MPQRVFAMNNVGRLLTRTLGYCLISLPFAFFGFKAIIKDTLDPWVRYGVSACAIGACLFIFTLPLLKTKVGKNILLLIFSSITSIYAVEGILTAGHHSEWSNQRELDRHVAQLNPFTKLEKILHLRKNGILAVPAAPAGEKFERGYVLGGISESLVVFCDESGEWATYQSDEFGFNNPPGSHINDIDLVLTGDSFTEGVCVNGGQDVASRLRVQGWNVLNLGKSGMGTLMQLATLAEYAEGLRPSYVLWLYYEGNDLKDLLSENRDRATLRWYLEKNFNFT